MAIVPRYGRRVGAPGPGGYITQPVYDRGLAAWEQAAGQIFGTLKERDDKIKAARESTEIVGRSARFSLDLNNLLTQTAEMQGTAEAQEAYFRKEVDALAKAHLDWQGATPAAQAKLQNNLVAETTQQIGTLRTIQRQRRIKEIADRSELALATSTRTGNQVLHEQALDDLVTAGIVTPAAREKAKADFPTEVRIERLRQLAETKPEIALELAQNWQAREEYNESQRGKLREIEANARGLSILRGQEQERLAARNGMALLARVYKTADGTAQPGEIATVADVTAAAESGQITMGAAQTMRSILLDKDPQADWASYNEGQHLIDLLQRGFATPEQTFEKLQPILQKAGPKLRRDLQTDYERQADASWADTRSGNEQRMKALLSEMPTNQKDPQNTGLMMTTSKSEDVQLLAIASSMFNAQTRGKKEMTQEQYTQLGLRIALQIKEQVKLVGPEAVIATYGGLDQTRIAEPDPSQRAAWTLSTKGALDYWTPKIKAAGGDDNDVALFRAAIKRRDMQWLEQAIGRLK